MWRPEEMWRHVKTIYNTANNRERWLLANTSSIRFVLFAASSQHHSCMKLADRNWFWWKGNNQGYWRKILETGWAWLVTHSLATLLNGQVPGTSFFFSCTSIFLPLGVLLFDVNISISWGARGPCGLLFYWYSQCCDDWHNCEYIIINNYNYYDLHLFISLVVDVTPAGGNDTCCTVLKVLFLTSPIYLYHLSLFSLEFWFLVFLFLGFLWLATLFIEFIRFSSHF